MKRNSKNSQTCPKRRDKSTHPSLLVDRLHHSSIAFVITMTKLRLHERPGLQVRTRRQTRRAAALTSANTGTSPLMNLPPELRNRVYDLLINTGRLTKIHPNILAVNRQIHQEASPILYGNQQFEIHIHIDGVLVHGLRLGDKYMSLLELQWPSWLKYVRNLRIELHEPGDRIDDPEYRDKIKRLRKSWNVRKSNRAYSAPQPRSKDLLQMSQVLYSLCSFLQSSNKLNRLELAL